jgi:tetratricopeptide (TPR) repeat protein
LTWEEHFTKGSIALARADYSIAQAQLNQALSEVKSERRISDARIASIYSLLAQSFYKQGNYRKAEPLLKEAVAIRDKRCHVNAGNKARDLICLAEIARSRGNMEEALILIDEAVANLQLLEKHDSTPGAEATQAFAQLIKDASKGNRKKTQTRFRQLLTKAEKKAKTVSREQSYFGLAEEEPARVWTEHYEPGLALSESTIDSDLEKSYQDLTQAAQIACQYFSRDDLRVTKSLTALARVATRLDLPEQAETLLSFTHRIVFGKRARLPKDKGQSLSAPKRAQALDARLSMAEFYSHLCDFQEAANAFADVAELLEFDCQQSPDDSSAMVFTASFVAMMQKADLYSSARLLTQQAIEFEEMNDVLQALALYDKALLIMEQVFPRTHLEIAQLLHFKTSALLSAGRHREARALKKEAEAIEDIVAATAHELEMRARRLPKLHPALFA